jgi:hypothetical protein
VDTRTTGSINSFIKSPPAIQMASITGSITGTNINNYNSGGIIHDSVRSNFGNVYNEGSVYNGGNLINGAIQINAPTHFHVSDSKQEPIASQTQLTRHRLAL